MSEALALLGAEEGEHPTDDARRLLVEARLGCWTLLGGFEL